MYAPLRQTDRLGRLTTALGADTLSLLRLDGSDHLNDLFEYRVQALAVSSDLDFDALVGAHATVEIEGRDGTQHFDGIVTQARWAGVGENGHPYDVTCGRGSGWQGVGAISGSSTTRLWCRSCRSC